MAQSLTVQTARSNLHAALVAGVSQPYTPKSFPKLVFGETVTASLYLVDDSNGYDTRSGAAGYIPRLAITLDNDKPQSGDFTISDASETTTALDWDATAEEVETALNALNTNTGPGGDTVTVSKFINGTYSILWDTVGAQVALTVSAAGIQPPSAASILPVVEGDGSNREEQLIQLKSDPLIFTNTGVAITNGWSVTLDANNSNFLRAVAIEAISANYSIELVSPTADVDVVARGPVLLEPSAFSVQALSGISYPDFITADDVVNERLDITILVGGTLTDLDFIPTLNLSADYTVLTGVTVGATVPGKIWALKAGTDASDPAGGIVRPIDYAATTNEKIWKVQL